MNNFKIYYDKNPEKSLPFFFGLSLTGNIGYRTYERLSEVFESPEELFTLDLGAIAKTGLLTKGQLYTLSVLRSTGSYLRAYEAMLKTPTHFVPIESPDFPTRLTDLYDPPAALYYRGKLPPQSGLNVSIIGARECSFYGEDIAGKLGSALGQKKIPVISGMARGIDSVSQIAALKAGGTSYALLGGGVEICYPKESRSLYNSLLDNGGIISEYPPGVVPRPPYFARRNRLISGLSDIVCVVEAKEKSGTLITVDSALEQGREVYAVPGRIEDRTSRGCNNLIKQGAGIITDPEGFVTELIEQYGDSFEEPASLSPYFDSLSPIEGFILSVADSTSFTPEELAYRNFSHFEPDERYNPEELRTSCITLAAKGLLISMGANRFRRKTVD